MTMHHRADPACSKNQDHERSRLRERIQEWPEKEVSQNVGKIEKSAASPSWSHLVDYDLKSFLNSGSRHPAPAKEWQHHDSEQRGEPVAAFPPPVSAFAGGGND